MNCSIAECHHSVSWVLKGASFKMYSCGKHLNQVALQMVAEGLAFMTLSVEEME
jgi:hypothetical protein